MSSNGLGIIGRVGGHTLVVSRRRLLLHLHLRLGKRLSVWADGERPVVEFVLVVAVVKGLQRLNLAAQNILLDAVSHPFELILRMNRSRDTENLIQFLQSESFRLGKEEEDQKEKNGAPGSTGKSVLYHSRWWTSGVEVEVGSPADRRSRVVA